MNLKHSKQRDSIKEFLATRKDHPTADTVYTADVVYTNVRQSFPNISLGTVYRNLTLLADLGEIARVRVGDGVDHFDYDTSPHYHFICKKCGNVIDLDMPVTGQMAAEARESFNGKIEGQMTYFYGLCSNCTPKILYIV